MRAFVCEAVSVSVRLRMGVAVYVGEHACARACVSARVCLCVMRILTLVFVFVITHVHTHVLFSCLCLSMCAWALSGITSAIEQDRAVRTSPYCMGVQASSRVHACVMWNPTCLNMWARWCHDSNQRLEPWKNQARAKRAHRFQCTCITSYIHDFHIYKRHMNRFGPYMIMYGPYIDIYGP